MSPREDQSIETVNTEQQDDAQVLDAADMERRDATGLESALSDRVPNDDPAELTPDDRPDLVQTMDAMASTGRIDTDAFAGERVDDDEEEMLGDTDDENDLDGFSIVDGEEDEATS